MASNLPCAMSCYFTQIIVGIEVVVVGLSARLVPPVALNTNSVFLAVFAFSLFILNLL